MRQPKEDPIDALRAKIAALKEEGKGLDSQLDAYEARNAELEKVTDKTEKEVQEAVSKGVADSIKVGDRYLQTFYPENEEKS